MLKFKRKDGNLTAPQGPRLYRLTKSLVANEPPGLCSLNLP